MSFDEYESRHFIQPELSWLQFNDRVLALAADVNVPLIQRLRFLGIYCNNRDEFFKVKIANLVRMSRLKSKKSSRPAVVTQARKVLESAQTHLQNSQQLFDTTYAEVRDEMRRHGVVFVDNHTLTTDQQHYCRQYFERTLSRRLQILLLRKTAPMPFLEDTNLYMAVRTESRGRNVRYAVIQIPDGPDIERFVVLPSPTGSVAVIFIDDIVRMMLGELFFMFNYTTLSATSFMLVRDAYLTLDDDVSKSVIEKVERGIEARLHGDAVHMVYDPQMPADLLQIISEKLQLNATVGSASDGHYPLLRDLMRFPVIDPKFEIESLPTLQPPAFKPYTSMLRVIRRRDVLVNYPYHSFNTFLDFMLEAAVDPKVKSINITLYRTADRSKVVNALINAAKNGKRVTVCMELMARFDEQHNMDSVERLQNGGVRVIPGIEGLKVHGKLVLIERKEGSRLRGYVYVGTGNFNESTARIYSDFGYYTANEAVASDARKVFDFLLNNHKRFTCKVLLVSPYSMRSTFEQLIEHEIRAAQAGKPALIRAKFNSLTDRRMIILLYEASQAGVEVRLIVRGACALLPQHSEFSRNIRVHSIVDKYLEHARMVIFGCGDSAPTYLASADWMPRNLDRRLEIAVPIGEKRLRHELSEVFDLEWRDDQKSWDVGTVRRHADNAGHRAQIELYDYYKGLHA